MIESGTHQVFGDFDIVDTMPLTEALYLENFSMHRIPFDYLSYDNLLKVYKKPYIWVIDKVSKYSEPMRYKHPQGAVIWVKNVNILDITCEWCLCRDCYRNAENNTDDSWKKCDNCLSCIDGEKNKNYTDYCCMFCRRCVENE